MIRFEPKKEPPKHVEHERKRENREAPELGRSVEPKVESKATGFDRTAYQREYMRRWRAKRERPVGRPRSDKPKPWDGTGLSKSDYYRKKSKGEV